MIDMLAAGTRAGENKVRHRRCGGVAVGKASPIWEVTGVQSKKLVGLARAVRAACLPAQTTISSCMIH